MSVRNKETVRYKYLGDSMLLNEKTPRLLWFLYDTVAGRMMMKVVSTRGVTRIVARFLDSRSSKLLIGRYIKKNKIDMSMFEEVEYASFNDFFKRKMKNVEKKNDPKSFIATASSRLIYYEISGDLVLNVKNSNYSIAEIIRDEELAKKYAGGICLVFRLSPADFHRYVFCDNGSLEMKKHIKGVLHTVNPIGHKRYRVFHENDRVVCTLDTEMFGKIIQIEVGALCVGKIVNSEIREFKKFQEKGYFEFGGSTIIQLIERGRVKVVEEIIDNSRRNIETYIRVGDKIGESC